MAIDNEKNREKEIKNNQNASVGNSKPTDTKLPLEDDPAVINPAELATFPKEKKTENPNLEEERDSHLANKVRSDERRGRNITKTGTMPDDNGFM